MAILAEETEVPNEHELLARWSGWGALPEVFDPTTEQPWAKRTGAILSDLFTDEEYSAARRSTINAHYTSPLVASQVWAVLADVGWDAGGAAWEPGSGIGVFMATAPDEVAVHGIELDSVTARLAARLHARDRRHNVEHGGLEDADVHGQYQVAIGNVPFADVVPHADSNPDRLNLHNLAIRQAVRSVEPGGLVALITSSWTLDARDPRQRTALAAEARFLGALRLPEETFSAQSGTRVTTDLVVFQRHRSDDEASLEGWNDVVDVPTAAADGTTVRINEWFRNHPELVIGDIEAGGLYEGDQLTVRLHDGDLEAELSRAAARLGSIASERAHPTPPPSGPPWQPDTPHIAQAHADGPHGAPDWVKVGGIYLRGETLMQVQASGQVERFDVRPKKDGRVIGDLIRLRDAYHHLIEAELSDDTASMSTHRADLNRYYDRIVREHGPLSQVKLSVRKDGVEVRRRPAWGGFRQDPDFATLLGLEVYDEVTNTAIKAAIFETRQLRSPSAPGTVETVDEAVALSLHRHAAVDPATVAEALGVSIDDAVQRLESESAAFIDPTTDTWVDAPSYLSGDVRTKLAQAEEAGLSHNEQALRAVLPGDLSVDEIDVQLGVPWVTPSEIREFVAETLELDDQVAERIGVAYDPNVGWTFSPPSYGVSHELLHATWGTERKSAFDLIAHGLRNETVTVLDKIELGEGRTKTVVNYEDTVEANQRLDAINLAFHDWLGAEPVRASRITQRYNELFRSRAPYQAAAWRQPPGLAEHLRLRPHQLATLRRIVMNETVGVWHAVGAGKTLVMASAAMELRRLGVAQKPMIVAPNHLVAQIAAETRQAFPASSLLVLESSTPDARRTFASQAAAGDWDAVIVSQSAFKAFPVDPATETAYIEARTAELREALGSINEQLGETGRRSRGTKSVKQIEKRIARLEERLAQLLDKPTDASVRWEALGVDALVVDEAHAYKNLEIVTARTDLASAASQRASDIDMKLAVMRSTLDRPRIVLASGTPISNSFHEMWVMMRLTDPATLRDLNVEHFDAFVSQFGQMVSDYEMGPTGFKLKSRFASFRNVPELQQLFSQTGDVKLPEDLALPRPALHGGQPTRLLVPSSPEMREYLEELARRANSMPADPAIDNHLKLLGDFRKAAVSLSLVGRPEPATNKITVAAEAIARRWHDEKDLQYKDDAGLPHPVTGSLQIVFLDLGVPGGTGPDLYARLRDQLTELGVPRDKIAFVHEARDPKALYRQAREGQISVLVGSTEKMGTGMNAQTRATALYHLDPPWRPSDIEQRNGRILRQGNQNPEVEVVYTIAEGSGDTLMYQGLERKARMIDLVMRNRNEQRRVEAPDSDDVTFGDLKGLASGDPRVIDLLRAKRTLGEIEIDAKAHERRTIRARRKVPELAETIRRHEASEARLAQLVAHQVRDGAEVTSAAGPIPDESNLNEMVRRLLPKQVGDRACVAFWGDDMIYAERGADTIRFNLELAQVGLRCDVPTTDLRQANVAQRLRNAVRTIPTRHADIKSTLDALKVDQEQARNNSARPYLRATELAEAKATVATLEADLAKTEEPDEPAAAATDVRPASPPGLPGAPGKNANLDQAVAPTHHR